LDGTLQLVVYADDINLLGNNIVSIKKKKESPVDASRKIGLEINTEKTKYMLISHHQNAGHNYNIKIANRCFENVAQLRYLRMIVTNQNMIQEEIKRRLNLDNVCYHLVQNLLFSYVMSKKVKIRIYKIIILPVVLYGCETWSLTLREQHRLRVFENKVLRRIFGPIRDEVRGGWRKLHNEELHNLCSSPSIIRMIKCRRMRWAGHVECREKREMHIGFWWESQKERCD
jgi:hypothetical protein